MPAAFLIDANVLVYALDTEDPQKQSRSLEVLDLLRSEGSAAVSAQVLAEFFAAVTRKIANPLSEQEALRQVVAYADTFPVYDITLPIVLEAGRGVHEHEMSYWDAQVWATAKLNQIPCVITEDIQGRHRLEGVRFLNPFAKGFDLSLLRPRIE